MTVTHGVHVSKKFKKEVKRHLHFCRKFGPESHLQRIGMGDKRFYREWLLGKIFYIKSIEQEVGYKLLEEFNEIVWPI